MMLLRLMLVHLPMLALFNIIFDLTNFIINTMKKIGFKLNNTLVIFECTNYTFGKLNSVEFNTNIVDLTNIDNTLNSINVSTDVGIVLLLLMESTINYNSILDNILDGYSKFIDNDIEFTVNMKELSIIFRHMIKDMTNTSNIIMFNNINVAMTNRFQFLI